MKKVLKNKKRKSVNAKHFKSMKTKLDRIIKNCRKLNMREHKTRK